MKSLTQHYHRMVGLDEDWAIADVDLNLEVQTLTLSLEFVGTQVECPECQAKCAMKDHAPERRW